MIFTSLFGFIQSSSAPGQTQGNLLSAFLPFIFIFVIFYVLIIMPSRKKQKRHQAMVSALKPGDKIITTGGIHGSLVGKKEDRFEIKIAPNVKIEISKSSVGAILPPKEVTKK